jgi:proton-translocating NADH-quinone oxidoreductase chain L
MFDPETMLWYIPALPLLGALLCALMGGRRLRAYSHLPCVAGAAGAFALTLIVLLGLGVQLDSGSSAGTFPSTAYTWFQVGSLNATVRLSADPLTAVMLLVITFVGGWIVIFSIGYMRGDAGYTRYFSIVSLFLAAMTLLVLADHFLLLFVGWEGVGLCSYLLIGYWYAKPSAAAAARKAFLMTRLGDVGMILGIFLLWSVSRHGLDFTSVFYTASHVAQQNPDILALACLLLFCGAVGKSAQIPLFTWLPDAMEGPTPVSALIHAATMVTAGVYLLARCAPLFVLVPGVQLTVAIIGAATALASAFIALTQHDLKRVLAYSTVSQLGFMFMALGTAGSAVASFAVVAAIFHLFTHAFFKALLFLSSGSVMHAMGGVIDMRRFGGLRKVLPITHLTFLCGAAALAGFPLLSGFWSKDQILETLLDAAHGGRFGGAYLAVFIIAMLTALLTAFYTFRAYFLTFWGELKLPPEAHVHVPGAQPAPPIDTHGELETHAEAEAIGHTSTPNEPAVMTVPLVVLALGALFAGAIVGPITGWIGGFLTSTPAIALADDRGPPPIDGHINWPLIVGSSAVALAGIVLAWWMYRRKPRMADMLAQRFPAAYQLSLNRLYVDEIYDALFARPLATLASFCRGFEALVFDLVRLVAAIPTGVARLLQPMQNGLVQFYGLSMAMGLAAFLFYLVFWAGR